jgi:hypothetical protein
VTVVDTGPFSDAVIGAEHRRSPNPSSPAASPLAPIVPPPASSPLSSPEQTSGGTLHVEPMIGLEWSQAIEQWGGEDATAPAQARRSWLHRAPESQVIALYRVIRKDDPDAPAPWWLRAMAAGTLPSRTDGFAVEDRVAKLLSMRPGWVYVPWNTDGDSGYWEFVPSERRLAEPGVPTTLMLTDRHTGWIDVYPVHAGPAPDPVAVAGLAALRANLAHFEALPPA